MIAPPKFHRHLPDFTGYTTAEGELVLYGIDYAVRIGVKSETFRQFVRRNELEIKAKIKAPPIPARKPGQKKVNPPRTPRHFHCRACRVLGICDNHHTIPRSMGGAGNCIRLCKPCHVTLHTLPNPRIATMNIEEQLAFIRTRKRW